MWGIVALQGLIVRTSVFGNSIKDKVNLFNGHFTDKEVILIRDAEKEHWISDGRPNWRDYCTKNRDTIHQGSRIVISDNIHIGKYGRDYDDSWRIAPFRAGYAPSNRELYMVEKFEEETVRKERQSHGWYSHDYSVTIYYQPGDTIYPPDRWANSYTRIRRVPCRLYLSEVLNFDTITLKDCDYYMNNRLEREGYLAILPVLYWIRQIRRKEQEVETHFKKLASTQLGWDEKRWPQIQEAIDWWKLKNKWKRDLMKDDSKALRMIIRKLNGQEK
jgi:hypothetical protein